MTKTIAKLWNGNLEPIRSFGKNNQEMHEIESVMQKNFEELEKALGSVTGIEPCHSFARRLYPCGFALDFARRQPCGNLALLRTKNSAAETLCPYKLRNFCLGLRREAPLSWRIASDEATANGNFSFVRCDRFKPCHTKP